MRPVRYKRMYPAGFLCYTDRCQILQTDRKVC